MLATAAQGGNESGAKAQRFIGEEGTAVTKLQSGKVTKQRIEFTFHFATLSL